MMRDAKGFSLVEVILAVGVIAFALVSLVALLAVGNNLARQSKAKSATGLLIESIVSQLRTKSFYQPQKIDPDDPSILPLPALNTAANATPFRVDTDNKYVDSNQSDAGAALKSVTITVAPPPLLDDNGLSSVQATATDNAFVTVEIAWPAAAPANVQQKEIYHTEIANCVQGDKPPPP